MSNNCVASFSLPPEEIDALLGLFPEGVVFLDTETTGLSPLIDEMVELASLKIDANGVQIFQSLVKPNIIIPENIIAIHGISNEMVQTAPLADQMLSQWFEHIGTLPLVAHNARFDLGFISVAAFRSKLTLSNRKVYCSCQMARKVLIKSPNHKLSTISNVLGLNIENHHRAADDTIACTRSVARMILLAKQQNLDLAKILNSSFVTQSQDLGPNALEKMPAAMQKLAPFVASQTVIEIIYLGGTHRGIFRPIKPIGLIPTASGQALYALCLLSDQHKFFSLSKIKDFRIATSNTKEIID